MTPLVEAVGLTKLFRTGRLLGGRHVVKAVDGVDLTIACGETLGLVGESGSGKSTTGRLLLRLIEPTAGVVRFDGDDITALPRSELRRRRRRMQIIFQDPYGSLNPRMTVGEAIAEAYVVHGIGTPADRRGRVAALLDRVGLPGTIARRYPHEFSGGQRQRIAIARALALEPAFIVCDEAVSALDVSIQAQIINLLQDLQRDLGLTYLFISHNLAVVRHISTRIAVMYVGRLVEIAEAETLFTQPKHPYTRALLAAIPRSHPDALRQRRALRGDAPATNEAVDGCGFASRCPYAEERCRLTSPPLLPRPDGSHVACHRVADATLPFAEMEIAP